MFPWHKNAACERLQNKIALRNQQGVVFSWKEVASLVNKTAQCLLDQGVCLHSGIAFYSKNTMEVVLLYLASIQLGARILGINPAFPIRKMQKLCKSNNIQFYYSQNVGNDIGYLVSLNLDIVNSRFSESYDNVVDFNIPVTMTLTSGTTGVPKAIVHNVQAHLDNATSVCKLMKFDVNSSWLLSLPLYHVSGQGIIWRWLLAGGALHLSQNDFYSSVISATHCSLVPLQLQNLLKYIKENNITQYNIKYILLGGSHIPVELTQQLQSLGICSYSGYGMTEMASTVFAKQSNLSSGVGYLLKGRQAKLVNNEIWLKGAGLALGYWEKGKIISLLNEEGWLATKDLGTWENEELVILGRIDNMFISGGENIYPEEIEKIILQYPDIEQVFVFPIPDKEFGNRPIAMVKFKNNFTTENINSLRNWLAGKIEKFKQPIEYIFLDTKKYENQGQIKLSRALLQKELNQLIRESE